MRNQHSDARSDKYNRDLAEAIRKKDAVGAARIATELSNYVHAQGRYYRGSYIDRIANGQVGAPACAHAAELLTSIAARVRDGDAPDATTIRAAGEATELALLALHDLEQSAPAA